MPDLDFTSAGAQKAETDIDKVRAAGKKLMQDYKEQAQLVREVTRAYNDQLSPMERLQAQATRMQEAMKNMALPDLDRNKAAEAFERINAQITAMKSGTDDIARATQAASKEITAAWERALTPLERMEEEAKRLKEALKNTELPDPDRAKATATLDRLNAKIEKLKSGSEETAKALKETSKEITTAWEKGLTPLERYEAEAERLREVLKDMSLPDLERNRAIQALERLGLKIDGLKNDTSEADAALKKMAQGVESVYHSHLEPIDKLRIQAEQMRKAISNTALPDIDRSNAAAALGVIEGKITKINENAAPAAISFGKMFGDEAIGMVASFATRLTSVAGVMAAIVAELKAGQTLVDQANATQMTLSDARDALQRSLPGKSESEVIQIREDNEKLAREIGVKPEQFHQAFSKAWSSSDGDANVARQTAKVALQFMTGEPGKGIELAGSALPFSSVLNRVPSAAAVAGGLVAAGDPSLMDTSAGRNPLAGIGMSKHFAANSRVTDQGMVAQNIAPAIIAAVNNGLTAQQAMALGETLSTGSNDETGSTTGTALSALSERVRGYEGTVGKAKVEDAQKKLATALERQASAASSAADEDTPAMRALADAKAKLSELQLAGDASPEQLAKQVEAVRRKEHDAQRDAARLNKQLADANAEVAAARAKLAAEEELKRNEVDLRGMTTSERLDAIRRDPTLAKDFYGDGEGFGARHKSLVYEFLTNPESRTSRGYASRLSTMPTSGAGFAHLGQEVLDSYAKANPLNPRSAFSRQLEADTEADRATASMMFLDDKEANLLFERLQRNGMSYTSAALEMKTMRLNDGKVSLEEASDLTFRRGIARGIDAKTATNPEDKALYEAQSRALIDQSSRYNELIDQLKQHEKEVIDELRNVTKAVENSSHGIRGI
jgi:hypothetical protein